jgi:putative transposase
MNKKMKHFKPRKQNRLKDYDYSRNGCYFVTICTNNRKEIFGIIANNQIILNKYGDIARNSWLDLPNHHKNIKLDEFVVMPNHIHGILIIDNPVANGPARSSTKYPKSDNLSVVIGSYKSAVSKQINQLNNIKFKWQKSFYDHIIRTDKSLNIIRKYIINNPAKWDRDENNIKIIKGEAGLASAR